MKNVIVAGVAALALVGCGSSDETAVEATTPVVEEAPEAEATPGETGGVPVDVGAEEAAAANQDEKSVADGEAQPE